MLFLSVLYRFRTNGYLISGWPHSCSNMVNFLCLAPQRAPDHPAVFRTATPNMSVCSVNKGTKITRGDEYGKHPFSCQS